MGTDRLTDAVRPLVADKDFLFSDRGEPPIRIWELLWRVPSSPSIDTCSYAALPCQIMKAVAVKELKNRLSTYLREVRSGEIVLVTDRGQVVAEVRQPSAGTPLTAYHNAVERLCAEGLLVAGEPHDARAYRHSPLRRKVRIADLLDAERGER